MITFQQILKNLSLFWEKQGCIIHQGYDLEVGAGTFNPATFLRCLGPEPYRAAYIEPCRRPADGRYGTNPNRLQHYFQYQVILKPSPPDIQDLYLKSLEAIGFNLNEHDVRFVHDDWESPTLGAWGLGWEVWIDGMEITQFTYFQAVGGIDLKPITGEITYGIERLAMYLQKVNSIYDLQWNEFLTYRDIYFRNEVEWSHYNFEKANSSMWLRHFEDYEKEAKKLIADRLPIPAYDFVMKASHAFNLLDARGVISVTERTGYIGRIRDLARAIAECYIQSREEQKYPLLERFAPFIAAKPTEKIVLPEALLDIHPDETEDFLLEVGSEELPATFVAIGVENLKKNIEQLLGKEEISFERISTYATPRRLAVYVHALAKGKESRSIEKKGPAIDQAYDDAGRIKPAGEGFFRSLNMPTPSINAIQNGSVEGISLRAVKGTDYLFANIQVPGRATASILADNLPSLILNLEFPKKMRWGDLDITYARPIRWIVSLFGKHVIPFCIGNVPAGRESYGHRQLSGKAFSIPEPMQYLDLLRKNKVMADVTEREKSIVQQLTELEKTHNCQAQAREKVLSQVVNLIEWPFLTVATFNSGFLKVPKEVLISEMVEHQKYFPLAKHDGSLASLFVITANIPPTGQIREGNQRVLSARLSDGVFLYEQGLKTPLDHFNIKLEHVTFQKDLGSVFNKVQRIVAHAATLQKMLGIGNQDKVARAALLCKADLASEMVYEFPELQGTIGRYYALAQNEDPEVAQAIDEHWMPRGENAPLPETETGIIVSLADKIDNLIGCFAIGLKPTSSSDPYALRRQVLGIIKILIRQHYRLPIQAVILECIKHFPPSIVKNPQDTAQEIVAFMTNRVKTVFLDYNFRKDEIEASLSMGISDIYDAYCRVEALHHFRESGKQFSSLYEVYKRTKGQLSHQQSFPFSQNLLKEPAEKELDHLLNRLQPFFHQALAEQNYNEAYTLIAQIQPALAKLFDDVKILADDPKLRENRLALLQRVFGLFSDILDFSKIQEKS